MPQTDSFQATACNLCSLNCGIEIEAEDRRFKRIRGDKNHPSSRGYLCQKASRLDYYQNHERRLQYPLRKRPDGSFERIDWDTAIREVAERLVTIRDTYGGHAIAFYGGGGQGNHLGGAYAVPLRAALGTPYLYNSLAQEKTGDFWVNGQLFGKQTGHVTEGLEETDYALILGANPWQTHGFPRARKVLREIAADPNRTLVVVDPRRTKSAELADIHLQVRPGTDAFLLAAMLGTIVQEDLEKLGIDDGDKVICESVTNAIEIRVQSDDRMLPGFLSAPHGYGMEYPGNEPGPAGPCLNVLTATDHCDPLPRRRTTSTCR